MDQQNNDQSAQVHFTSDDSTNTPKRSLHMKKSSLIAALALLIIVAAIPLTVKFSQQQQNIKQRAAEAVTCHRCSNTEIGKWATFQTNDACDGGESNTAQPIPNTPISYEDKAQCRDIQATVCTFDKFKTVPDWAKGNDSLGNGDYCGPVDGQTKPAACGDKDTGWVPGPKLELGSEIGVAGHYPNWYTPLGGKLPVAYDSHNDITRHEFSGRMGESNWSRFIRRMDDSYFGSLSAEVAQNQISTGVVIKYEILRIARDSVHNLSASTVSTNEDNNKLIQDYKDGKVKVGKPFRNASGQDLNGQTITPELLSQVTGFDVTALDLTQWSAATNDERKARMIAETSSCGSRIPAAQPTASTPVNCEEHLLVPPPDFKTDFPSYTKNVSCPAHVANQANTGRTELDVCGEYWVSAWCNATDEDHRRNATYACRGWSQIGNEKNADGTAKINNDRNLLYYTNRLHAVTSEAIMGKDAQGKDVITGYKEGGALKSNIDRYGDILGRKKTWNSFMTELKYKSIAYPWEHDNANKSREEVRNNALQSAATAIFGKSWGEVKEIERMNNCSTTWDGPTGGTPNTGITCHRCSNQADKVGQYATFQTNDACPGGESTTAEPIPGTPISYEPKASCNAGGGTAPTVTFSADKTTAGIGDTVKLTWTATGATACSASGDWSGSKTASGGTENVTVATAKTYTYTLSCTGAGGTTTKNVTVTAGDSNPNGTKLNITVVLHGIGAGGTNDNPTGATGNQNPKRTTRNAKIIISDETDSQASRKEATTTLTWDQATKKFKALADVSSLNLTTGSYTVKIKIDQYLTRRFGAASTRITAGQTNNLPEAQLISGNTNNDTVLSILDYNILRGCISVLYPARDCNAEKKLAADLTDDEKVDTVDYELFIRELAVQQGD